MQTTVFVFCFVLFGMDITFPSNTKGNVLRADTYYSPALKGGGDRGGG